MMTRFMIRVLILVAFLASQGFAGPNTALVKVLKGEARLGNRVYRSGFLISDGDKLVVKKGSVVMLKFLQESIQKRIVGPVSLTMNLQAQRADAAVAKRGTVGISKSLGMSSRTGGMAVRGDSQGQDDPKGEKVAPQLTLDSDGEPILILFDGHPDRLPARDEYRIDLIDHATGEALMEEEPITPSSVSRGFQPEGCRPGRTYQVSIYKADSLGPSQNLLLRIPTTEEEKTLEHLSKQLESRFSQTQKPQHMIELAELYLALDQPRAALEALSRLEGSELGSDFEDTLQALRKKTLMPLEG